MRRLLLCILLSMPMAARAQAPGGRVQNYIDRGMLADAERSARAAGDSTAALLGDVLVLRGRLAAADSVYRDVVVRRLPEYRRALAALAELASRRGDRAEAVRDANLVVSEYLRSGTTWSAADEVAAGRAEVVLGRWNPQAFHDALSAFDGAGARDSSRVDGPLRAADLLLDKYNAPDARESYRAVLKRFPGAPRALLGLARADAFEGRGDPTAGIRQALAGNPSLTPAWLLLAEQHLEAEAYDSATVAARHALAIDSSAVQAWAILGAIAWMQGDSAGFRIAHAVAERLQPSAVDFYSEIAEAAGRQRRYGDAIEMAHQAVRGDSGSARAYGVLAENQLRTGDMTNGRANLEHAFVLDPYNLWHKNMLDLLDKVRGFKTITTARFQFVAPADEADYLVLYLGPLLQAAYDTFTIRYGYRPTAPIRVEMYGRHADFSVRTVGLTGLGALGVSFGNLLVMDSPRARETGEFNYGSTAWHELAHTFTLGVSNHRVPRWISEGLSVLEERRAGHGWGFEPSTDFLAAYKGRALPTPSHLNDGLVRPDFPAEIAFSYYEASLACEMIESEHGIDGIRAMLRAFADGLDTPAMLQRVFAMTPDAFDQHFDAWVRARFATTLAAVDSSDGTRPATGSYVDLVQRGAALRQAGSLDSARTVLLRAEQVFPDDGSADGPAWQLARIDRDRGNLSAAIAELATVTMHDETALDANDVDATLRLRVADSAGALAALERQQWIVPYDANLHVRIAELSEAMHDMARAVRERRAIVALGPSDPLEARYQLARVLLRSGDREGARQQILQVLERAPAFEKAQALLLQVTGNHS